MFSIPPTRPLFRPRGSVLSPLMAESLLQKEPGTRTFFEAWIFSGSDEAEEKIERDVCYEVEKGMGVFERERGT